MSINAALLAVILLQQGFFGLLWVGGAWLQLARRASWHWGLAALLVAVALTLVLRREDLSPWLGFFTANVLLVGAFMLLRRGLALFARQPTRDAEQAAILVLVAAVVGWAVAEGAAPFVTATVVSASIAWICAFAAWQLSRALREEFGVASARACAAPFALVAVLFAVRAALAPLLREQVGQSLVEQTGFNTGLVFVFLGLGLLINATLASIVVLRLVRKLEHSSEHDQLTGLLNRRGMTRILERESMRHLRFGQGYALLLIDIDHFKAINDRHGHAAGDTVLAAVADALRAASREVDRIGRMGGEEFSVLLPNTDLPGAEQAARRLLDAVRSLRPLPVDPSLGVTISIGVGVATSPGDTLPQLQRRVDQALYAAKAAGRDRVEIAMAPDVPSHPPPVPA